MPQLRQISGKTASVGKRAPEGNIKQQAGVWLREVNDPPGEAEVPEVDGQDDDVGGRNSKK